MLLTYQQAAELLGVGVSTLHRMRPEYGIRVVRVRTGASKRGLPRIESEEIERVIAQMRAEADNDARAGRSVPGGNACQKTKRANVIKMGCTSGQTRRTGTPATPTQAASELGALLKLQTSEKPKR